MNMKSINETIKNNIMKILACVIVIQPIIDLIIGVSMKQSFFPNIMSLIRLVILLFLLYYLSFISNDSLRKKGIIFTNIMIGYLFLFYINNNFSFEELKLALKVYYLPLMFITIYTISKEKREIINDKYLLIALFLYAIIIIFGALTNTSFNSYFEAKEGTSGYFNAANEVGGIIAISLPFVFYFVFNNINIKKILYFLIIVLSIIILGTKTPFISLMICAIYYFIKLIIRIYKSKNKKNVIHIGLLSLGIVVFSVFVFIKTPVYENVKIHLKYLKIDTISEFIERPDLIDHFVLGSRLRFLTANSEVYWKSNFYDKMFGLGYTEHIKLVEMDFYDIFYRQGIVGFVIYLVIFLNFMFTNDKKINKHFILPLVLIILTAAIVGHMLTAPAVSTFVAFILCNLLINGEHQNKTRQ